MAKLTCPMKGGFNRVGGFLGQCCMCLMFVEEKIRANGPAGLSRDI